jgi:hypothetical protein
VKSHLLPNGIRKKEKRERGALFFTEISCILQLGNVKVIQMGICKVRQTHSNINREK